MGKRFAIAIVCGIAAASVIALGAQTAAAASYDTRVTISKDRHRVYHGHVNSEVLRCERRRHVALFKQRRGADRKLGGTLSVLVNEGRDGPLYGMWLVITPRAGLGVVYARARPKVLRNGDMCLGDRSPNWRGRVG